jgi:hypothetical protein
MDFRVRGRTACLFNALISAKPVISLYTSAIRSDVMAKGQKKSTKEIRKPKKSAVKVETVQVGSRSEAQTLNNIKKPA